MNTPELLPCPFCGESPSHIEADANQGFKYGSVVCCIRGPDVRTAYDRSADAAWHKNAIEAWNTRAYGEACRAATLAPATGEQMREPTAREHSALQKAAMRGARIVSPQVAPQQAPALTDEQIDAIVEGAWHTAETETANGEAPETEWLRYGQHIARALLPAAPSTGETP